MTLSERIKVWIKVHKAVLGVFLYYICIRSKVFFFFKQNCTVCKTTQMAFFSSEHTCSGCSVDSAVCVFIQEAGVHAPGQQLSLKMAQEALFSLGLCSLQQVSPKLQSHSSGLHTQNSAAIPGNSKGGSSSAAQLCRGRTVGLRRIWSGPLCIYMGLHCSPPTT